jgi:hypothetical protein
LRIGIAEIRKKIAALALELGWTGFIAGGEHVMMSRCKTSYGKSKPRTDQDLGSRMRIHGTGFHVALNDKPPELLYSSLSFENVLVDCHMITPLESLTAQYASIDALPLAYNQAFQGSLGALPNMSRRCLTRIRGAGVIGTGISSAQKYVTETGAYETKHATS